MRFLLVDDHGLFREGLKLILAKMGPDTEIIEAEALDTGLVALKAGAAFDLILWDLRMPGMKGIESIGEVVKKAKPTPVVVMSGAYQRKEVMEALEIGAAGFVPKTLGGQAMINALNLVMSGERYVPSVVFNDEDEPFNSNLPIEEDADDGTFDELTGREKEVLIHLMDGHSNKAIANILDLQEVTVRAHLKGVFRKLGVSSRTQAVGLAMRKNFKKQA